MLDSSEKSWIGDQREFIAACAAARAPRATSRDRGRARLRCGRSNRSSRSLSASSISACRPVGLRPAVIGAPCAAKKRSISRSFSSRPRRQRQRSLLSARSSMTACMARHRRRTVRRRDQTARRTISSLILPIARGRVQPLRADVDAVHDRVAAEQAVRILEVVEALAGVLVAAVGDEAIGLQQAGRADELVGVPPEARAGGRAARAQDALVQAVQLVALLGRLQALLLGRQLVVDEVRLDRVVLLEELRHVDDQVAHDRQPGQRLQHDRVLQRAHVGQARQAVLAVDVHRVGAADAFAARAPEAQASDRPPSASSARRAACARCRRARPRSVCMRGFAPVSGS